MEERKAVYKKRPELKTVGIRIESLQRLRIYASNKNPRLVISDIVSIAVDNYLAREKAGKE